MGRMLKGFISRMDKKFLAIVALAVIAILFLLLPLKEQKKFEIEDKCGRFINVVTHTIETQDECRSRCRSQCSTEDMGYSKIDFEEAEIGCNECTCFCR